MKLSNFKLIKMTGDNPLNKVFIGEIDVETGILWWKKKQTVSIHKVYADNWFFVSNGEYLPYLQISPLLRSWTAKTGEEA